MSYIGAQPTTAAFITDTFNGTGSQTAFTMSAAPANTNSILVSVSGVLQDPSTYSVNATTLTFSAAPPSGTGNISVRFLGIPASGVTTTAYRTVTEFTATAGQTTFTPPSYTVGYINVYRNGALLGTADYTATNGTTVVLASAASSGDLVVVESFYVSSVLNAIPATNGAVTSAYLLDGSVTSAKFANLTTLPTSGGNITLPSVTGTAMVSGNMPTFYAFSSGSRTITGNGTDQKVVLNTESWDTANCFDPTTNYRFTPNVAGYYQINMGSTGSFSAISGGGYLALILFKNGSGWSAGAYCTSVNGNYWTSNHSNIVYLNGTTDYVEMYINTNNNGTYTQQNQGTTFGTFMSGALVRAA